MQCHHHPDRSVERECRACHHLICSECVVLVGEDAICKSCVADQLLRTQLAQEAKSTASPHVRLEKQPEPHDQAMDALREKEEALYRPQKSSFLTVLFSCLPGLGHYYLGLEKRGLNLMILFFGLIFLVTVTPSVLNFPLGLAFPVLWFYSQFDALKYRTLIAQGVTYKDEPVIPQMMRFVNLKYLGWLLTIIALLGVFRNLLTFLVVDYNMQRMITEILSAFVLLGIGFWIIKGKNVPFVPKEESEDHHHA